MSKIKGDFFSASNNEVVTLDLLLRLWQHFSAKRRLQYLLLLILMLISTLAEVLSLGAVIPFLGVLVSPESFFESSYLQFFITAYNFESASELVLPFTLIFMSSAILAGGFRLLFLWVSTRVAFNSGLDISYQIYDHTLYQPYQVHISRNSSEVVSGIVNKVNGVVFWTIIPVLTLISTSILLVSIVLVLVLVDPLVALSIIGGFGFSYGVITLFSKKKLLANGDIINREQNQVIKALQDGLGGIRDVLLNGTQSYYSNIYRKADTKLRHSLANNNILGGFPRPAMESLGMVLIALMAYIIYQQEGGIEESLPLLGAIAIAAQRLLPALQNAYSAWANIIGGKASLENTVELLEQPIPSVHLDPQPKPLVLENSIEFSNVRFRYVVDEPWILDGVSFSVYKGQRVGIVGLTGSGKSTVLDILLGLIKPFSGTYSVDQITINDTNVRSWQGSIAHVPQSIYLSDKSFTENIAFGVSHNEIDIDRVKYAASRAQISSFIESKPEKYNTIIGEFGVKLSGGQRQRIGIARALYKQASVLVFDEATSSLDNVTEESVMESIRELDEGLTVIIVAHRLTTIEDCDSIIELRNGKVVAEGNYKELIEHSESFRSMIDLKS